MAGAAWATSIGQLSDTDHLSVRLGNSFSKPEAVTLSYETDCFHLPPIVSDRNSCYPEHGSAIPSRLRIEFPVCRLFQTYVLVLGIYYKLQTFLYLPANGAIQGMRPLLGFNAGAGNISSPKIYKTTAIIILLVMTLGMILSLTIPEALLRMFTRMPETILAGVPALRTICFGFVISSLSIVSAGALEALGKGPQSLIISALRYVLFSIPIAFLLTKTLGIHTVWNTSGLQRQQPH
ncbi:MAG: MATE family efflux transporter [Eubacterium sp.]